MTESPMSNRGLGGGGLLTYCPTFVPKFQNNKIPKSHMYRRGGGGLLTYFPTFIPGLKNDKIPNGHKCLGGRGQTSDANLIANVCRLS